MQKQISRLLPCPKHVFNYYWKHGKCKGSICILCGHIDKTLKPQVNVR